MADDTCSCRRCQIRRAAFGCGHGVASSDFEKGLAALASVLGMAVASASSPEAISAVDLFTRTQNEVRQRQHGGRSKRGDLSSAKVARHG